MSKVFVVLFIIVAGKKNIPLCIYINFLLSPEKKITLLPFKIPCWSSSVYKNKIGFTGRKLSPLIMKLI